MKYNTPRITPVTQPVSSDMPTAMPSPILKRPVTQPIVQPPVVPRATGPIPLDTERYSNRPDLGTGWGRPLFKS